MASNYSFNQDFESDDEELSEIKNSGRDATIFVLDCNKFMFEALDEDDMNSLFMKCLFVLERHLLNKIIKNHKDLVSFSADKKRF